LRQNTPLEVPHEIYQVIRNLVEVRTELWPDDDLLGGIPRIKGKGRSERNDIETYPLSL